MTRATARRQVKTEQQDAREDFSQHLLAWFDLHGRKHLPWQQQPTPYPIWVSEIMLQQTQVSSVIPYYQRFMSHFPDLESLATAPLDEVLRCWSGLGYYARARNLHKTAGIIQRNFHGRIPDDPATLQSLPGIGRSTAAAILALSTNQRHTILDGNVKRVLCRYHAVPGWPGQTVVSKHLWTLAEQHTPARRVADYTQAIMDLGATLCTRGKPRCADCPLGSDCQARQQDRVSDYPQPRPRRTLPHRSVAMLILHDQTSGSVLLEKRPPTGIWGGLWSLPEYPCASYDEQLLRQWCREQFLCEVNIQEHWPLLKHRFTHFQLNIQPLLIRCDGPPTAVMEDDQRLWYNVHQIHRQALATPARRLLEHFIAVQGELE